MQRNYYMVVIVFITFFVISFITNILGALIPDIQHSFQLSYAMDAFLPFQFARKAWQFTSCWKN